MCWCGGVVVVFVMVVARRRRWWWWQVTRSFDIVDRSDAWHFRDYVHGILGLVEGYSFTHSFVRSVSVCLEFSALLLVWACVMWRDVQPSISVVVALFLLSCTGVAPLDDLFLVACTRACALRKEASTT